MNFPLSTWGQNLRQNNGWGASMQEFLFCGAGVGQPATLLYNQRY
jgi:hypothetical protein